MLDDDPEWLKICARHPAWERARKSWVENGMLEEHKWQRCLKGGRINDMDDNCWTALIAANPE